MSEITVRELTDAISRCIHVASPGDTVFLRFDRPVSAEEAQSMYHLLKPIAVRNNIGIAIVDGSSGITINSEKDRVKAVISGFDTAWQAHKALCAERGWKVPEIAAYRAGWNDLADLISSSTDRSAT